MVEKECATEPMEDYEPIWSKALRAIKLKLLKRGAKPKVQGSGVVEVKQ